MATAAANGKALSFAYNESGIRTQKTVDGVTTEYYLDGSTVLAQKTGNNTVWYYYDCNGTREALEYGGQVYYYLYNAQGDVMALYDNDLNIVAEYTYDSWGRVLSITGSLAETVGKANPFRYRGYYYDSETELYYLNSRYYDPETGRWINADDQLAGVGGEALGYNLFAYCKNNPVNMSDHSGQWPKLLKRAIVAVIATAVLIARAYIVSNIGKKRKANFAKVDDYLSNRKIQRDKKSGKVKNVQLPPDKNGLMYNTANRKYASKIIKSDYGNATKRTVENISAEIFAHEFVAEVFKFTEPLSNFLPEKYDIYGRLSSVDVDENEDRIVIFEAIERVFG